MTADQDDSKTVPYCTKLEVVPAAAEQPSLDIAKWGVRVLAGGVIARQYGRERVWKPYRIVQGNKQHEKQYQSPAFLVAVGPGLQQKSGRATYYAIIEAGVPDQTRRALYRLPVSSLSADCGPVSSADAARLKALHLKPPCPANYNPGKGALQPIENKDNGPSPRTRRSGSPSSNGIPNLPAKADMRGKRSSPNNVGASPNAGRAAPIDAGFQDALDLALTDAISSAENKELEDLRALTHELSKQLKDQATHFNRQIGILRNKTSVPPPGSETKQNSRY
jgi:hypothetical protein